MSPLAPGCPAHKTAIVLVTRRLRPRRVGARGEARGSPLTPLRPRQLRQPAARFSSRRTPLVLTVSAGRARIAGMCESGAGGKLWPFVLSGDRAIATASDSFRNRIRFDCYRDDLPVTLLQRRRQLLERRLEMSDLKEHTWKLIRSRSVTHTDTHQRIPDQRAESSKLKAHRLLFENTDTSRPSGHGVWSPVKAGTAERSRTKP
jgi:hypothetical protein